MRRCVSSCWWFSAAYGPIAFSSNVLKILDHVGVDAEAPRIAPVRGPQMWDDCGEQGAGEGVFIGSPARGLR